MCWYSSRLLFFLPLQALEMRAHPRPTIAQKAHQDRRFTCDIAGPFALLGTLIVNNLWFGELLGSQGRPGGPSLADLSGLAWLGWPCLASSAPACLPKPKTMEKPVVFEAFGLKMLKNHWFLKPPG